MDHVDSRCSGCDKLATQEDKFCNLCGKPIQHIQRLPYVGASPDKGVYRITLVAEDEFRSKVHAEEVAGRSTLYEGDGKIISRKIEFVRTTVGPDTHPFVCSHCRDQGDRYMRQHPPVSHTDQGRCEYCSQQSWERRE